MISQTELQDEPENSPSLILKIDLRQLAVSIEEKFGDLLQPAPEGVYSFRHVEPVLVPGKKYYICKDASALNSKEGDLAIFHGRYRYARDPSKVLIEIVDWQSKWKEMTDSIYTETGEMLISSSLMADKRNLLDDKPILPYRGMRMAHLIYDRAIDQRITWPHLFVDHIHLLQQQLLVDAYSDEDLDIMLDPFHVLALEYTFDFIDRHQYFLFSSRLTGSTLTLTRYQDYRVLAWHRDQREKQQAQQERQRC